MAYEARLERDRPKIEALEAKIAELTVQAEREEIARSAAALEATLAPVRAARKKAQDEYTAHECPAGAAGAAFRRSRCTGKRWILGTGKPVFSGRRSS